MVQSSAVQWDLDPSMTHINHGSFGAVPRAVSAQQAALRAQQEADPVSWFAGLPPRIAASRTDIAQFLGANPAHTAFVLNASAGASTVFDALATGSGAVDVLTTDHGYGAVTMGAQRLAARTGGQSHEVAIPLAATAQEVIERIDAALAAHQPTLLVIDQISSATARLFPVDDICRKARQRGVLTLVDGAHAPGTLADPVCHEADYWVGNLHKFACSPRGAALLVARDGHNLYPIVDSWGTELPYPDRFDHIGTMDSTAWMVAPWAWQYLDERVGWEELRNYAANLLDQAVPIVAAALSSYVADPIADVGMPVGTMRLLRLPAGLGTDHTSADGLRIPFINETGIACAFAPFNGQGYLRLSAHIYNTVADYQRLATVGVPLLAAWAHSANSPTA